MNRPILLRNEGADQHFALDDQPQRNGLDAPGGKPAAHFVPKNWRNFVAHNAVEHPARLLRIHQVGIYLPGLIEGRADRFGRDFVEGDAKNLFRIDCHNFFFGFVLVFLLDRLFGFCVFLLESRNARFLLNILGRLGENHGEMRRNGLPLAVRVARQIDGIRGDRRLAKIIDDFALARNDLQRRLKNLVIINADQFPGRFLLSLCFLASLFGFTFFLLLAALFFAGQTNANRFLGQVHHVADGRFDGVVPPQIFVNRFRLCGRFDNNQRTSHVAFVTP